MKPGSGIAADSSWRGGRIKAKGKSTTLWLGLRSSRPREKSGSASMTDASHCLWMSVSLAPDARWRFWRSTLWGMTQYLIDHPGFQMVSIGLSVEGQEPRLAEATSLHTRESATECDGVCPKWHMAAVWEICGLVSFSLFEQSRSLVLTCFRELTLSCLTRDWCLSCEWWHSS